MKKISNLYIIAGNQSYDPDYHGSLKDWKLYDREWELKGSAWGLKPQEESFVGEVSNVLQKDGEYYAIVNGNPYNVSKDVNFGILENKEIHKITKAPEYTEIGEKQMATSKVNYRKKIAQQLEMPIKGVGVDKPVIEEYFEIITEESAEQGDVEESGHEDTHVIDIDEWDKADGLSVSDVVAKFLKDKGITDFSASFFHPNGWYVKEGEMDMYDGSYTNYSFHLKNMSDEQKREVYEKIMGKNARARNYRKLIMARLIKNAQAMETMEAPVTFKNLNFLLPQLDYNIFKGRNIWETANALNVPEQDIDSFITIFKNRYNKIKGIKPTN